MAMDADHGVFDARNVLGHVARHLRRLQQDNAAQNLDVDVLDGARHIAMQANAALIGEVIDQCRRLVEEQRQVIFDPGRHPALRHVLVDTALGGIAFDTFPKPRTEYFSSFL